MAQQAFIFQATRMLLLAVLAWASPVRTQEKTASIAGAVVDSGTGLPVSRVEVQLLPHSLRTFSDENGHFAFEGLPGGSVVIHTRRVGYSPARLRERKLPGNSGVPVDLIAGQRVEGTISISPAPVVTGRVIDAQGQPVQGVRVTPYRLPFDRFGRQVPVYFPEAITDDRGIYRSAELAAGDYFVKFEGPAVRRTTEAPFFYDVYYPGTVDERAALPVSLASGVENRLQDIVLHTGTGHSLTINILSAPGETAKGSALLFIRKRNSAAPLLPRTILLPAKSIEAGRFAPGTYDVEFSSPMSSTAGRATIEIVNSDVSLDLRPERAVAISAVVRMQGLQPMPNPTGVQLYLLDPLALRPAEFYVVSQADGSFRGGNSARGIFQGTYQLEVTNVPANLYVAGITLDGERAGQAVLDTGRAQTIEVHLRENPAAIKGTVKYQDSQPAGRAFVVLVPDEPQDLHRLTAVTADAAGNYELRAAPGGYRLYSWTELDGMAYRNAEFMRAYYDRGRPLQIGEGERLANVDLQALD